jgi:hypothetical protein
MDKSQSTLNRPTKKFLTKYFHDGRWWATDIMAYDREDAEARCQKLRMQLEGEHIMDVPAVGGSWLADLICWWNNFNSTPWWKFWRSDSSPIALLVGLTLGVFFCVYGIVTLMK